MLMQTWETTELFVPTIEKFQRTNFYFNSLEIKPGFYLLPSIKPINHSISSPMLSQLDNHGFSFRHTEAPLIAFT